MGWGTGYAQGKYSWAACDRCGIPYPYQTLVKEKVQYKNVQGVLATTNFRYCTECADTDTYVKHVKTDAIALRNPRPIPAEDYPLIPPPNPDVPSLTGLIWDTTGQIILDPSVASNVSPNTNQGTSTFAPPTPNMSEL